MVESIKIDGKVDALTEGQRHATLLQAWSVLDPDVKTVIGTQPRCTLCCLLRNG